MTRRILGAFAAALAVLTTSSGLLLFVGVQPAAACSCGAAEVSWFVDNTDAGFIGTLEESRPAGGGDEWASRVNRFSVEGWTHGDLDDGHIDVWAPDGGAACGLELRVGQTAAIFLDRRGDRYTSSLCSTLDANVVRAALTPDPLPGGQARFAVPGVFPRGGMALLNDEGLLIGYDPRFDFEWTPQVFACPGGRRAVIIDSDQAFVIDLTDLSVTEVTDLQGLQQVAGVRSVHCADSDAAVIELLVDGQRGIDLRRLDKVGQPGFSIGEGAVIGVAAIAGDYIVAQSYLDPGEQLVIIEPDGSERIASKLLRSTDEPSRGYVDVAAQPDHDATADSAAIGHENVVAVLEADYGDFVRSRLWILNPYTGEQLVSREFDDEAWSVRWLGTDRLLVAIGAGGRVDAEIVDAVTLETVTTVENFDAFEPVLFDGALIGLEGSAVRRGSVGEAAQTVAVLPSQSVSRIILLTEEITVEPSQGSGTGLRPATRVGSSIDTGDGLQEAGQSGGFSTLRVLAAAIIAAALGAVVYRRRRQQPLNTKN